MTKNCCSCLSTRQKGRQKTRPPPYFFPISGLNFGRWISWGWIFLGPLLLEKKTKNRPKNSGPKFGRPNFVPRIQFGFRTCKRPLCRNLALIVFVLLLAWVFWLEPRVACYGGKLKGSLLRGSFDKRVRIDLPVPLPAPTLPRPPHPPSHFPSFSPGKPLPTTPPNPDPNS